MKTIYNDHLPLGHCDAMCVYPFLFVRNDRAKNFTPRVRNHETIHACQQVETFAVSTLVVLLLAGSGVLSLWWLLGCPFVYFVLYAAEWLVRWVCYGFNATEAYGNISYEQEAYQNMDDYCYVRGREPFASFGYLPRKTYNKNNQTTR